MRGFLFSLEAAFSITLAIVAAACLPAFAMHEESPGNYLACSDAAGVLAKSGAFASQEKLQAAVDEAGELLGMCIEAESAGMGASSCDESRQGSVLSFAFPVWSGGKLQNARVACWQMH